MQRRLDATGARSADQRPRPSYRAAGFSTWLALVALLLQVVVPLGQAVPLPAGGDLPLRSLVICTAYGPRMADPAAGTDARGGASPSAAAAHNCPVCSALGFCAVPTPAVAAPLPAAAPLALVAAARETLRADRAPASTRARDPPAAGRA